MALIESLHHAVCSRRSYRCWCRSPPIHPPIGVTMGLWKAYVCLLVILLGVESFRVPISRNARGSLFTNLLLLHAKGAIDYPNDATDLANIFGDLSNEMLNVSVASISPSMSTLSKEEQLEIFEIARQEQDLQELTQNLKARLQEKWDIEVGRCCSDLCGFANVI